MSPEPVYGADGKRVNTREYRYRKKLDDERHKLVEKAIKHVAGFKPPLDYKRPSKIVDKVYIPTRDFPELNFIGLLIGPRGNTLKKMETESGAKVSIRGKGSVKEGKIRSDGNLAPGEEEDLHCLITADSDDKIKKCTELINKIIETATSVPEGQNELKRLQLRELASLNGTLRDEESQVCNNCGAAGHRRFECPEQRNFTANLVCRICNGVGHIARDCTQKNNPSVMQEASQREQKLDNEYASLMAELGSNNPSAGASGFTGAVGGGASALPPWASASASSAASDSLPPWASRSDSSNHHSTSIPNNSNMNSAPWKTSTDSHPASIASSTGDSSLPPWIANNTNGKPYSASPRRDNASNYEQLPSTAQSSSLPPWLMNSSASQMQGLGMPAGMMSQNSHPGGYPGAPPPQPLPPNGPPGLASHHDIPQPPQQLSDPSDFDPQSAFRNAAYSPWSSYDYQQNRAGFPNNGDASFRPAYPMQPSAYPGFQQQFVMNQQPAQPSSNYSNQPPPPPPS